MVEGAAEGHMMACGTNKEGGILSFPSNIAKFIKCSMNELVLGHAYSILDVKHLQDDKDIIDRIKGHDGKRKLLKIRNPWGTYEWNGDWSDNSNCWNDKLKEEVNLQVDEKDGIFWMCYDDFCDFFTTVDICKSVENYWRHNMVTPDNFKSF
jgi:hypothetical protein